MRRAVVLAAFALSAVLAPSTSAKVPLPCDYWVHGCNAAAYVCDAGVCLNEALPALPPIKP